MEIAMLNAKITLPRLLAFGTLAVLGACAPMHHYHAAETAPVSNPPPVAPGPQAIWYHVEFATGSFAVDANGQSVISAVVDYLQQHPSADATIIGKTDSVGGQNYNMHLSHQRADVVRNALVYDGKIAAERVETRWTGETRQAVATANDTAEAANRVVDIAIH
jgi:outer membrane protein OmpA-like peptidoglycan-associated protein